MKTRLTQFLTSEQLTPARFADILGVQRSGISHILSGRNKPGFDLMEKMVNKFPDVNAEWLITGRGKMYKEEATPTLRSDFENNAQYNTNLSETAPVQQIIPQTIPQSKENMEGRCIAKIIILYTDKSFSEYHPE